MTKSVKEWMKLLNESVSTEVEDLIEDPQVDEYYEFLSNTGVELRGRIIAADGDDYTLESDGEIYHVSNDNLRAKSYAGEITEGAIKTLSRDGVDYQAIELDNGDIVAAKLSNGKITHYFGKSGKWFPTIVAKNGTDPAIERFSDADEALDQVSTSNVSATSPTEKTTDVVKTYEKEGIKYSVSKVGTGFVLSRTGKDGQPSYYSKTNKWFPSIVCNKGHAATIAVYKTADDAIDVISNPLHESVLTEALNTKQIMAALVIILGLSPTAHAGLLTQMAAAVEDAAPKVGAAIVAKAKEAAEVAGKAYDEQSPKVVAAAKDAAEATKDAIATYGPKVIDAAKSAGMTTADYVAKYYNEKSPEVIDGAKKLGMTTAEYIKVQTPEVIAAAKKAGISTGDYLAAQHDDKSPAVKDAGKKAAKAAGNAVEDVADRSKRAAKEFVK